MQFIIDTEGVPELKGALRRLRDAGEDPRQAFEDVADYFEAEAAEVFRTRGTSTGRPWRPLSAKYARNRKARPMGVQSGVLRRSMTTKGARYHRRLITRDSVTVKSVAPHAHLFDAGHGKQPGRTLVKVTARTRREVAGILQRHLTGDRR